MFTLPESKFRKMNIASVMVNGQSGIVILELRSKPTLVSKLEGKTFNVQHRSKKLTQQYWLTGNQNDRHLHKHDFAKQTRHHFVVVEFAQRV